MRMERWAGADESVELNEVLVQRSADPHNREAGEAFASLHL